MQRSPTKTSTLALSTRYKISDVALRTEVSPHSSSVVSNIRIQSAKKWANAKQIATLKALQAAKNRYPSVVTEPDYATRPKAPMVLPNKVAPLKR